MIAILAASALLYASLDVFRPWLWLLDGADLIIHEAGHPVFSALFLGNRFMMFAGGTAFQLIMPAAFVVSFLRQGQPKSSDVCLAWLGQNFLHMAPYVADARAQALPLVGGGEHDWNYLLGVFGLLGREALLGRLCAFTGCLIVSTALYSLGLRLLAKAPEPA